MLSNSSHHHNMSSSSSHPTLYVIGSTCLDIFLPLESFPVENQKYRIQSQKRNLSNADDEDFSSSTVTRLRSVGGNANNLLSVYCQLASIHSTSEISPCLKLSTVLAEEDIFSSYIRKWYSSVEGKYPKFFHSDYLCERKGSELVTPCTYILVVRDTRTCIHHPCETMKHLNRGDEEIMSRIIHEVEKSEASSSFRHSSSWIYSDTRHGEFVNAIMEHVPASVSLVLDCEKWRGNEMVKQLERVVYCFMNLEFPFKFWTEYLQRSAESFSHDEAIMELWNMRRNKKDGFLLRTLGERGSFLLTPVQGFEDLAQYAQRYDSVTEFLGKVERGAESSPSVTSGKYCFDKQEFLLLYCTAQRASDIVDTTGAGDTYIGSFLYHLQNTKQSLMDIMKSSSICAAAALSGYGNHFQLSKEVH